MNLLRGLKLLVAVKSVYRCKLNGLFQSGETFIGDENGAARFLRGVFLSPSTSIPSISRQTIFRMMLARK